MFFKKFDTLFISSSLSILVVLTTFLYIPSLPFIVKDFGHHNLIMMSFSCFLISNAIAQLITVIFFRSMHKNKIIVGCSIIAIGSVIAIFSQSALFVLLARVIQGFGAGVCSVTSKALLRIGSKDNKLRQNMAQLYMIVSIVPIISPIIGSCLQLIGSWKSSFIILTILSLIIIMIIYKNTESSILERDPPILFYQKTVNLYYNTRFLLYGISYIIIYALQLTIIATAPFIMQNMLGISLVNYGILLSVASLFYLFGSYIIKKYNSIPNYLTFMLIILSITIFYYKTFVFGIFPCLLLSGLFGPYLISKSLESIHKNEAFIATAYLGISQLIMAGIMSTIVGVFLN